MPEKRIEYYVDENGCYIPINCSIRKNDKDDQYPFIHIKINGEWKQRRVSRFLYERLIGPIPKGYVLRHTCDNPKCINLDHLIPGTHAQNVRDRVERGRSAIGERNGRAKLTEQQVKEIKYIKTLNNTILAYIYNVDVAIIRRIKQGKIWKHIQP